MGFVACGGFLGAILRFLAGKWINTLHNSRFPWGTFFINISGSFVIGICLQISLSNNWQHFFIIGFLGAYTTFSTFSYEFIGLLKDQKWLLAVCYVISTWLICLLGTTVGYFL